MNIMLGYWYKLYISQTECETLLEKEVCKLGVRYRTQHPFLGKKAFADIYFPDHKLVVEIDDPSHDKPEKIQKDLQRTKSLEALGLRVIRCTNSEVRTHLAEVVERISRAVKEPWPPSGQSSQPEEYPTTPEPKATGRSRRNRKSSSTR